MDLKELKELVKNGGKVVVVENDKPVFVVVLYEDFKNTSVVKQVISRQPVSREIPEEEFTDEELTLDDLPLE